MNRKQRRASGKTEKPQADPIALHAEGIQAFQAGDLDLAAKRIVQAIATNRGMASFHYNLAIVRKAQGKLKDAAASYRRAIALKPDYADAHNNLGNIWKLLGEPGEARASFARALQARPGNADSHYNLGLLCCDAGDPDARDLGQATQHFRACLEQDPEDSRGVKLLLAHLGLADAPERTSPAQLQKIYDVRSRFWDQESSYFAHSLVTDALRAHAPHNKLDILDIGCGTGLVGAGVRASARRLDGVDLSPAMLEKARGKNLYDRLEQADIIFFMAGHQNSYDTILGAATLIHFGDLQAVFQAAATALRPSGLFVFTLFANEVDGLDFAVAASDRLAQSGCYTHNASYVERLAPQCAFSVLALSQAVHEHDQDGNPVTGLVAVLKREAAIS